MPLRLISHKLLIHSDLFEDDLKKVYKQTKGIKEQVEEKEKPQLTSKETRAIYRKIV